MTITESRYRFGIRIGREKAVIGVVSAGEVVEEDLYSKDWEDRVVVDGTTDIVTRQRWSQDSPVSAVVKGEFDILMGPQINGPEGKGLPVRTGLFTKTVFKYYPKANR